MVDITTLNSDLLSLLVANISWTAPEYNNAPITGYNVSICYNIECFVENPAVPYLLLFVKPTYTYTINITATNVVGDSVISDEGMFMGAMESEMSRNSVCVRVCVCRTLICKYTDRECLYHWKCLYKVYVQHTSLLCLPLSSLPPPPTVDSMANLTTGLVTDSVVILEWTLPPLANISDSIKPQTPESQFDISEGEFDVSGYFISILDLSNDPVYLEGRDNTNYLFSGGNGLPPGPERITISLTVNYSLAEINDLIPGVTNVSVDIPSPGGKMLIHNVTTLCVLWW